ncbi:DUF928 domain-containing protein [Spirulina sp. CS-785/01]|uniref:DUF928 domain-containing protein n=1 Tax=Spirulina sp. CS-785/01 TaxID=3021716 RepID=UPI00232B736B|nr:DUF928 domain-containing protein [Spirulina sp. CS-785/01]MDB9314648.1 DUF928 domain-containing protein [Spirulina sp. CS-785/01]
MPQFPHPLPLGGLLAVLCLGLSPLSTPATPANSLASLFQDQTQLQNNEEEEKIPPTRGAGTRPGKCGSESIRGEVFPLTPSSNLQTTASPHPSLYLYLPTIENQQATFWVLDETETIIYETEFTLSNEAGILQIPFPEDVTLDPDTIYKWGFFIHCDPENRELDEAVMGWMTYTEIAPPPSNEPLQQAEYYGQAGIWQQTLELLLQLRNRQPDIWQEFLEAAELGAYRDAPRIN